MKKFISTLLTLILVGSIFAFPSSAAQAVPEQAYREVSSSVEYLEDGSCLTTTVSVMNASTRARESIRGRKVLTFHDSKGHVKWELFLYGDFSYDGVTSTCNGSSVDYKIYDSTWRVDSLTTTHYGNYAYADYVMKRYKLGVRVQTESDRFFVTCNAFGKIS